MPYYEIKDFAAGLDLRKSAVTAPAGTLRKLENAQVTPGGEIEKRAAFSPWNVGVSNTTTFGLVSNQAGVWVLGVGGGNTAPNPTTAGRLGISDITGVGTDWFLADYDLFDGRIYVIIYHPSFGVRHYFQDATTGVLAHVPDGRGSYCRTYKSKMHTIAGKTLYFSAVNDPTNWTTGTGAGFINLAIEDADMYECIGLEVYYDFLAVMSRDATQLWSIDPDPAKNQFQQTLRQAGTPAPQSLRQYGSGDVLFMGLDGIRSLKARAQSVSAAVSDIGSPVDPMIRALYEQFGTNYIGGAKAHLQPYTGRYWMVLPDRTLVLSNFPEPKISAWSLYWHDGFAVSYVTEFANSIYMRATNGTIYKYGGDGSTVYDSAGVTIELPFLHFDKPATFKTFKALDVACTGQWDIYVAYNPENPTAEDYVGRVTGPTFLQGQFALAGHSTHCSLRFRSAVPGALSLASIMIHYDLAETT